MAKRVKKSAPRGDALRSEDELLEVEDYGDTEYDFGDTAISGVGIGQHSHNEGDGAMHDGVVTCDTCATLLQAIAES